MQIDYVCFGDDQKEALYIDGNLYMDGDYYHDKISDKIEGFLKGLDYCNSIFDVSIHYMNYKEYCEENGIEEYDHWLMEVPEKLFDSMKFESKSYYTRKMDRSEWN